MLKLNHCTLSGLAQKLRINVTCSNRDSEIRRQHPTKCEQFSSLRVPTLKRHFQRVELANFSTPLLTLFANSQSENRFFFGRSHSIKQRSLCAAVHGQRQQLLCLSSEPNKCQKDGSSHNWIASTAHTFPRVFSVFKSAKNESRNKV